MSLLFGFGCEYAFLVPHQNCSISIIRHLQEKEIPLNEKVAISAKINTDLNTDAEQAPPWPKNSKLLKIDFYDIVIEKYLSFIKLLNLGIVFLAGSHCQKT